MVPIFISLGLFCLQPPLLFPSFLSLFFSFPLLATQMSAPMCLHLMNAVKKVQGEAGDQRRRGALDDHRSNNE